MTRPVGELRAAIEQAARELCPERGAVTWCELAERAQVGYEAARRTVANMERDGALLAVGSAKPAYSRRWMRLYEPASPAMTTSDERAT